MFIERFESVAVVVVTAEGEKSGGDSDGFFLSSSKYLNDVHRSISLSVLFQKLRWRIFRERLLGNMELFGLLRFEAFGDLTAVNGRSLTALMTASDAR